MANEQNLVSLADRATEEQREIARKGGIPYEQIVEVARKYITDIGGFEKFAEWGLF